MHVMLGGFDARRRDFMQNTTLKENRRKRFTNKK